MRKGDPTVNCRPPEALATLNQTSDHGTPYHNPFRHSRTDLPELEKVETRQGAEVSLQSQ